jgi:LysM repeat protein
MKKFIFIVSLFTLGFVQNVLAQNNFIIHAVKKGETLSALAKTYGTTVGDIMRLNGMNTGSKLLIGEKVKIPTNGKPVKANVAAAEPPPVPVISDTTQTKAPRILPPPGTTHVVQKGETLWTIGKNYHVFVAEIRQWNNLQSNAIKIGQVLQLSAQPAGEKRTNKNSVVQSTQTTQAPPAVKKQNKVDDIAAPPPAKSAPMPKLSKGGFFASFYGKGNSGKSEITNEGAAMIFKSTSGVTDKKYYILMNDVAPGSIVKISYGDKLVYAKVLWNLGNIKDNEGLDYRISNAAATALGIDADSFNISVSRFQ